MGSDSNEEEKHVNFFSVGSCEIIVGPMFAGKSSRLYVELGECADIGLKCLYVNHVKDTRNTEFYDSSTSSHSSNFRGLSDKIDTVKVKELEHVNIDNYDVVGIDEGQFFTDLNDTVRKWVFQKKRVIVASLDGDIHMNPFGQVHMLMCLCDPGAVTKLGARCKKCMSKDHIYRHHRLVNAGFTILNNIDESELSGSKNNIKVGGANEFQAVCMKCYVESK